MILNPTLVVSIDRSILGLADLTFSGTQGAAGLYLTAFTEPARPSQHNYAADGRHGDHGSLSLGWRHPQATLEFTVQPFRMASETAVRTLLDAIPAAITQTDPAVHYGQGFEVAYTINGSPARTYLCQAGDFAPTDGRRYVNLANLNAAWSVVLPCHPIPLEEW